MFCVLVGVAQIAPAQTIENDSQQNATLRTDVRKLVRELLDLRAEFVQWKLDSIGMQLDQVRAERQRLAAERQLIEREIGDLSQISANGPGGEDDVRRDELKMVQLPAVWERERAATLRESVLASALHTEKERLDAIRQQRQRLEAETPKHD
jgi:hypothetical protein